MEGRVEELESSQAAPEPIANVEFREGSATRIPFGDNSFNRIIYFDVDAFIFNASDKVKAIQEILRVIDKQKGGLIHARPKASAREKDLQDFIALFNTEAARMGVKLDYRITRFSDSGIGVLFIIRPPSLAGGPVAQGGIDLRSLPIVTQSVNHLKADIRSMSVSNLQRLDLSSELLDIQRLVSSGIVPSVERIKEFFAAGCLKGALPADAKKVTSCIASILRTQEQSCELTNPALKDILVVLNSGGNLEEFKLILAR